MARSSITDIVREQKLATFDQIEQARRHARSDGDLAVSKALVDLGYISNSQMTDLLSIQFSIPRVSLIDETIETQIPHSMQEDFLRRHCIFPYRIEDDQLLLAIHPPIDPSVLDEVELTTGYRVKPMIATTEEINLALNQHFNTRNRTRQTIVDMHVEDSPRTPGRKS